MKMFQLLAEKDSTDSIPRFVQARIDWATKAGKESKFSFLGIMQCLFSWDKEDQLRENFDQFAQQTWMPFSDKYIDWMLEDSEHQVMTMQKAIDEYENGKEKK